MLMVGLVGLFWTNSTSDYFLTLYPLVGVQNIKKYGTAELTKMNLLLLLHFVSHLIKKTDVSAIHIEEKRREEKRRWTSFSPVFLVNLLYWHISEM